MADEGIDPYIVKIRDEYFHIEIFLYNELEDREPVPLPFSFVDSFSITESLLTWNTTGWIIINTPFEVLERGGSGGEIDTTITNATIEDCYIFRTDGRNKISFRLYHVNENGTATLPAKYWEMCYDFVIYDSEDIETYSNQSKMRKYKFWDERFQILLERNIEYSTAYSALKEKTETVTTNGTTETLEPSTFIDKDRSYNPNEALKDVIKTAASNPPVMGLVESADKLKVGFKYVSDSGTIQSPTEPMDAIDEENWDVGNPDNKVFYTSPANFNALQDMDYLLGHCVSSDGSPVFLEFGRHTSDKKWKLISLSNILKTSNDEQVESLYIEDGVLGSQPPVNRANIGTTTVPEISLTDFSTITNIFTETSENKQNSKNFTSAIASRITSYSFCPLLSKDDSKITNDFVHSYDFATNSHNIHIKGNRAIDVRDELEKFAKEGLYSFSKENTNSGNAHILLTLNQTKTKGMMIRNTFVPQVFYDKNITRKRMLRDATVYNQALNYRAQGLTLRAPGKFIAINRVGSDGKINPFDDRFLGQWLMVDVEHVFTKSSYHNNVVAVKIDTFSKLWSNTEDKN